MTIGPESDPIACQKKQPLRYCSGRNDASETGQAFGSLASYLPSSVSAITELINVKRVVDLLVKSL